VLSANELTNTEAGTLTYFAPELIAREYYTKAIDFWTLGVFLYELATFESPFKEH
jgi:serine/threonine protein kinase